MILKIKVRQMLITSRCIEHCICTSIWSEQLKNQNEPNLILFSIYWWLEDLKKYKVISSHMFEPSLSKEMKSSKFVL